MSALAIALSTLLVVLIVHNLRWTKIGTKTILFGVHQFLLHPLTLAYCWGIMYKWSDLWNPKLWLTFFVHDIGYWGKPNIDGEEGERHPELGASIMRWVVSSEWGKFSLYHSRFYSKRDGEPHSFLCQPDKLTYIVTPRWLYKLLSHASGEVHEYMSDELHTGKYDYMLEDYGQYNTRFEDWHAGVSDYMIKWILDNEQECYPYKPGFRLWLERRLL